AALTAAILLSLFILAGSAGNIFAQGKGRGGGEGNRGGGGDRGGGQTQGGPPGQMRKQERQGMRPPTQTPPHNPHGLERQQPQQQIFRQPPGQARREDRPQVFREERREIFRQPQQVFVPRIERRQDQGNGRWGGERGNGGNGRGRENDQGNNQGNGRWRQE